MLGYEVKEMIQQPYDTFSRHTKVGSPPYTKENSPRFNSAARGVPCMVADEILWRRDESHFPIEYTSMPCGKKASLQERLL